MRFERMKNFFTILFKFFLFFLIITVAWREHLEYAGMAVFFLIAGAYIWKWESKILLFSGLFLLFSPTIFLALGRRDLIVPHVTVYGWILIGVWCVEIFDYAIKHWPAYIIPPVSEVFRKLGVKKEQGKASLRQAVSVFIQKHRNASEKAKFGTRNFFLFIREILFLFGTYLIGFFRMAGKVFLSFVQKTVRYVVGVFFRELFSFIKKNILIMVRFLWKHRNFLFKISLLIFSAASLYFFMRASFGDTLILIFFLCGVLFRWKMEVSIVLSMGSLILALIFLIFQKSGPADFFSIYAYYFLIIGIFFEWLGRGSGIKLYTTVNNFFSHCIFQKRYPVDKNGIS